jgi:uncharacterized protein (DUF1697 family)
VTMRWSALLRGVNVGGGDEFVVAGADLRLPNGAAKANLVTARLDKAFRTVSTMRNRRAVSRLLERLEA